MQNLQTETSVPSWTGVAAPPMAVNPLTALVARQVGTGLAVPPAVVPTPRQIAISKHELSGPKAGKLAKQANHEQDLAYIAGRTNLYRLGIYSAALRTGTTLGMTTLASIEHSYNQLPEGSASQQYGALLAGDAFGYVRQGFNAFAQGLQRDLFGSW